jgi:hypothetical protein
MKTVPQKRSNDPYLYLISIVIYTSARVAKPGQRRQVQGLVSQEFLGSNPIPRITCDTSIAQSFFN